jgi:hypothetical protein
MCPAELSSNKVGAGIRPRWCTVAGWRMTSGLSHRRNTGAGRHFDYSAAALAAPTSIAAVLALAIRGLGNSLD